MKNATIIILLLTSLAGGYYALSQYRIPLGDPGKTEKIIRSDLTLPINATGEVRPARRIVIKAEASGEVLNIYRQDGEFVEAGELLIRLEKDEEQRSVDRAQQDLDRANARLKTTEVVLERCQTTDRDNASAAVDQIKAMLELAKFRADSAAAQPEMFHEEELIQRKGTYQSQLAQLAGAQAQLEGVDLAVRQAEQDVAMSQASRATALTVLEDAKKRLRKTEIKAPISGILARVRTHVGEVIQGGKTTFTGGTELAVILDVSKMLVRAEVDESDLERVLVISPEWAKPGNDGSIPVPSDFKVAAAAMEHVPKITVEAYRNREFEGVIERIYPEPKVMSGVVTYQVDVVVIDDAGEMHAALLGGHIDTIFEEPGVVIGMVEEKLIIPVIILTAKRLSRFPDVPAAGEIGVVPPMMWRGIAVKRGTPPEIVKYLEQVFTKSLKSKMYKSFEKNRLLYLYPGYLGSEDLMKVWEKEFELNEKALKIQGLIK